jgi:hypothetical protein
MSIIRSFFLLLFLFGRSSSFTSLKLPDWSSDVFGNIFPGVGTKVKAERERVKGSLLEACREDGVSRIRVEEIISELASLSPVAATATSPLLQRKWMLEWTTEKEINFFLEKGFTPSGAIYQTIDGSSLGNMIPFQKGGGFGVQGDLSIPDEDGKRTDFVFTNAVLDLGKWGKYSFPPVGKGWFDTIYLDEDLRVDVNSRDDILICTPSQDS